MREVRKGQVLLFVLVDAAWFEQSGLGGGGKDQLVKDKRRAWPVPRVFPQFPTVSAGDRLGLLFKRKLLIFWLSRVIVAACSFL